MLNIFQYILTHSTIINEMKYNKEDFFKFGINSIVVILSSGHMGRKTVSMYLKSDDMSVSIAMFCLFKNDNILVNKPFKVIS